MTTLSSGPARRPGAKEIREGYAAARAALLAWQTPERCWRGELSPSALATATAVSAFCLASRERFADLIRRGAAWLIARQNADGGWGDTPESRSNLSTTMLAEAALLLSDREGSRYAAPALRRAGQYLDLYAGASAESREQALCAVYGEDRTFAAPILTNCALARPPKEAAGPETESPPWRRVPALPFELACLPRASFRWLNLEVVSYALPALIAVGQLRHHVAPSRNPLLRALRAAAVAPTLRRLEAIQPESGGFLEATPLTSFVVMSLAGAGRSDHPAARRGLEFLSRSVRADGSWPIDTDLSHWLTSLAVASLTAGGNPFGAEAERTRRWILGCQHRRSHLYTGAAPGGWAWTDRSGGVPDADDTSAALLALSSLGGPDNEAADAVRDGARAGVEWLLNLQNRDGGWPTFCRGWGKLPFDRSAPDLTAHALRAISAWRGVLREAKVERALPRGVEYLRRTQRADGAWLPLWFGNQQAPRDENPLYGTARVLAAWRELGLGDCLEAQRGVSWLIHAQNPDGGWGGAENVPSSIEETSLALDALACPPQVSADAPAGDAVRLAFDRGCAWLLARIREGGLEKPAPIGLYFAKLWYAERVYPALWAVSALGRALGAAAETR
jgi:squalene-hopene/tetraprenyl-beta-curcumene cyclase